MEPMVIGYINGQPVYGLSDHDQVAGTMRRYLVKIDLGGLPIATDAEVLYLGDDPAHGLVVEQWHQALALAEAIDQLVALARQWITE